MTADGQLFPQLPPPVSGLADGLPVNFKRAALESLRKLSTGENSPYKPFADDLITQSGLGWSIEDQASDQFIMRSVVEHVLADPMVRFGVLECQYGTENIHGQDFTKLASIRLTPVGKGILGLLK